MWAHLPSPASGHLEQGCDLQATELVSGKPQVLVQIC